MVRRVHWLIAGVLGLLVILSNPIVMERLLDPDGEIESISLKALLWAGTSVFGFLLVLFLLLPAKVSSHARHNWKNYLLSSIALLLIPLFVEVGLRVMPRPVKGIDMKEQTLVAENYDFRVTASLNSSYFRDDEFTKEKDENTFRIILIGDSLVFGAVQQHETIDRLLEKRLNQGSTTTYQVYNLGKPAATTDDYYHIAKQFITYNPDVVIVSLYVDNDILGRPNFLKSLKIVQLLHKLDSKLHKVSWRKNPGACIYGWIERLEIDRFYREKACKGLINPGLLRRARVGDYQQFYGGLTDLFTTDPTVKRNILAIKNLYDETPFILLLSPSKYQVSNSSFPELEKIGFVFNNNKVIDRKLQDAIISWAASQNIDYIDLLPYMKNDPSLYYQIDDHYTAKGNKLIARVIHNKLISNNIIPPGGKGSSGGPVGQ